MEKKKGFIREVANGKTCLPLKAQKQRSAGVAVQSRRNPMPNPHQFVRQAAAVLLACVLITGLLPGRAAAQMAHYKLEGNFVDATGTQAEGTITGGTATYTTGPEGFGQAADFSTSGWRANLGTWNPGGTFSMTMWIKDPGATSGQLVAKRIDAWTDADVMWQIDKSSASGLRFQRVSTAGATATGISNIPMGATGTWFHFAITLDNCYGQIGTAKVYINGVLQTKELNGTTDLVTQIQLGNVTEAPIRVGSGRAASNTGAYTGQIDDLRFYSTVLTESEIQTIMNGTTTAVSKNDTYFPNLLIYPNPAHDYLVIDKEIPLANPVKIDLVNVSGISVFSAQEVTLPYTLRLKGMNPGIYFLKIHFPEGVASRKIIVK